MLRSFFLLILCCCCCSAFAQKLDLVKTADAIQKEGEALYRSEWASWYGTDIFTAQCADKAGKKAGYLSYDNGKGLVNVFYSKDAKPVVLATTTFDYSYDPKQNYKLDTTRRALTKGEKELYILRAAAMKTINTDTVFKFYNNASLNPVPLIYNGVKKVYVLTGPNVSGVVLFGNDYLIAFNKKDEVSGVTKLHNSLIVADYGSKADSSKAILGVVHSHIKGKDEFITVTDVCTLLLYQRFTTWKTCSVISEKYVSTWDCLNSKLSIFTHEEWDKIDKLRQTLETSKN